MAKIPGVEDPRIELQIEEPSIEVKVDAARYRPNDAPLLLGDPARIRGELGWVPHIPIEQTIDDLLRYWRRE